MLSTKAIWVLIAGLVVLGALSLFVVDVREKAIVLQFGRIVNADYGPGLKLKMPYPFQEVRKFDARIQNLDAEPTRFLTSEKKNVKVDWFAKWRIQDVERFYLATSGGNMRTASDRLATVVQKRLRDEFGKRTVVEVVSGERREIMRALMVAPREAPAPAVDQQTGAERSIPERMSAKDQAFLDLGIEIVDVRLKRIDLPEDVSGSVFQRMDSERQKVAKDFRSRGSEAAKTIRAEADRDREVIIAEANRDAERLRGEGDGKAAEIYANAYSKNESFYTLYRSLNAYRSALSDRSDILVMEPDAAFFKYFKDPEGKR